MTKTLNSQQIEAIEHVEGPLLVLAGAGSGKTHVVTSRIVHLIEQGVSPDLILGLTFTNKAAEEMRERVQRRTHQPVLISTFHSLGARFLREYITVLGYGRDFVIYDAEDAEHVLKACIQGLEVKDDKSAVKSFKGMISRAKDDLLGPSDVHQRPNGSKLERAFPEVYRLYQEKLKDCQAVDFDDLIYLPVKILSEHGDILAQCHRRWAFFLVDEFQDTNEAQYQLIKMLVQHTKNLCVVGDPDQSIYSWRGANVRNILNFTRDYPETKVIKLEQNYRSTNAILQAANALIEKNENRLSKNLWSLLGDGEKPVSKQCQSEQQEVQYVVGEIERYRRDDIALRDQVIFYRTNFQSRAFEDELLRRRIPYIIVGGVSFYQRREIKDVLAFLRMVHSDSDLVSFTRTVNLPKRGIGDKTIQRIHEGASAAKVPLFQYVEALMSEGDTNSSIRLSKAQRTSLQDYVRMIRSLKEKAKISSLHDIVQAVVDETGYSQILAADPDTLEDRTENVEELVSKAAEWEVRRGAATLSSFLEELSLKSHVDELDPNQDKLNLMTLHNSKGLEFEVVYMVGMEEGLFPHVSARDNIDELEEERRLCYVGMTRAKRHLRLTMARYRYLWGTGRPMVPSCFLREIPSEYLKSSDIPFARSQSAYRFEGELAPAEEEEAKEAEAFAPGDVVFHKQFGLGTIKKSYQGSLGLTYEIAFSKEGTSKTIVAKYAHLSKL